MKYVFGLLILAALFSFRYMDDVYSNPLKDINGQKLDLNNYRGKKMLFVILPLSSADTTVSLSELSSLQSKYQNSLIVFGVPAVESGFRSGDEAKIKQMFKDQPSNFILLEVMKVKKEAGKGQASLFQWLTNKDQNRHFNQDVQGGGHKFFVDEKGVLYAVMGPMTRLSYPVIDRILSKPMK